VPVVIHHQRKMGHPCLGQALLVGNHPMSWVSRTGCPFLAFYYFLSSHMSSDMNSKTKSSRSVGRIIQTILLALSGFWLISFLFEKVPVYLQELQIADSVIKAGLTPSSYSPTANFIGSLSVPLFCVVIFAIGVYPTRWGKWIRRGMLGVLFLYLCIFVFASFGF
jgi:hypothetical protein